MGSRRLKWLDDLSIRYKIILIATIGVVAFSYALLLNYLQNQAIQESLQQIEGKDYPILQLVNELQDDLLDIDRLFVEAIAEGDREKVERGHQLAKQIRDEITRIVYFRQDLKENADKLTKDFINYHNAMGLHVENMLSDDYDEEFMIESFSIIEEYKEEYKISTRQLTKRINQEFSEKIKAIGMVGDEAINQQIAVGVFLLLFMVTFSYWIIRNIISIIQKAVRIAEAVAVGQWNAPIMVSGDSEINVLIDSLAKMRDKLRLNHEKNQKHEILKDRISKLNDAMRGDQTREQIANSILNELSKTLRFLIGNLYVEDASEYRLAASFACDKNSVSTDYSSGQSLVGQCARQKEMVVINDLPKDYIKINSSLGNTSPKCLYLIPFLEDEEVKGILEIGTLTPLDQDLIEFLSSANKSVAIAIQSAQSRWQLSSMLKQTQEQAVALESQQEELRASNEELELQTRELRNSEQNLQSQQEELRVLNEELEERAQMLDHQKSEILEKNSDLERSKDALIEKTEQLEQSGRYKSQFLSTMSHELRTPLNSILILSQSLSENNENNLNDKQVEHARVINSSGSDLLALINDILDLSKVEEGKLELVTDTIRFEEMAAEIKIQFEYQFLKRGLDFDIEIDDQLPESFRSDSHRINQVLRNFISNALKFTHSGGITIKISRVDEVHAPKRKDLSPSNAVTFSVIDTGIGIPLDKQALVFEAFKQADGTTSRKYGGTGLGLTISTELAHLLGGEIQLYSAGEGTGSSFMLLLPLVQTEIQSLDKTQDIAEANTKGADSNEELDSSSEAVPGIAKSETSKNSTQVQRQIQPRTLLVIEDEDHKSELLEKLSGDFNLETETVANLEAARRYLQCKLPSAVLIGEAVDEASAHGLAEELKRDHETHLIPVHIITQQLQADGISDSISKDEIDSIFSAISEKEDLKHLLVVEDDAIVRELIGSTFRNQPVELTFADCGRQAIELSAQQKFDCFIVDLGLPDIEGLDLLERLRQQASNSKTPIIVYTARNVSKELEQNIRKYADRIILKEGSSAERLLNEASLFMHWIDNKSEESSSQTEEENLSILEDRHVLMVDDDMRNIYSLTAALEDFGLNISTATNGIEALEFLEEDSSVELILMDIMMPEMDGFEAISLIRQKPEFKDTPIIALTAKAMKDDREKCIEVGASDYFSKPVDVPRLKSIMKVWLGNRLN